VKLNVWIGEEDCMLKRLFIGALAAVVFATGSVIAGQCTGGDKLKRATTAAAPGLNPQPLPPGRRRYLRKRRHRGVITDYNPQWGGFRRSRRHRRHPNALTVKQK
jgi:hypothetical protein